MTAYIRLAAAVAMFFFPTWQAFAHDMGKLGDESGHNACYVDDELAKKLKLGNAGQETAGKSRPSSPDEDVVVDRQDVRRDNQAGVINAAVRPDEAATSAVDIEIDEIATGAAGPRDDGTADKMRLPPGFGEATLEHMRAAPDQDKDGALADKPSAGAGITSEDIVSEDVADAEESDDLANAPVSPQPASDERVKASADEAADNEPRSKPLEVSSDEKLAKTEKNPGSAVVDTPIESVTEAQVANVSDGAAEVVTGAVATDKDTVSDTDVNDSGAEDAAMDDNAEDLKDSEAEAPTAEHESATSVHPVVKDVLAQLKGKGKATAALRTYYDAPDRTPLWVGETDLTDKAKAAIEEIQKADEYGLSPSAFKLPVLNAGVTDAKSLASAEVKLFYAILTYARHAKGGRVSAKQLGSQLEKDPKRLAPKDVISAIAAAEDPAAYLRGLHPKHPQFVKLRKKLLELRSGKGTKSGPQIPLGPLLKRGVKHEQVALLRKRLKINADSADENEFDEAVELAVKRFQAGRGIAADGVVGNGTRKVLNGVPSGGKQVNKILLNMERWRWLPENLYDEAGIHVWSNIPEYRVRIVKEGEEKPVFSERTIVGLLTNKTPVFSDEMEWIEIHPTWYVPNSIKKADILPSLKRPTSTVMERYNLKLNCGSYGSNPKKIDWSRVNITSCEVTQPPGPKSVLGDFKFKFPNKHAVYMHDTHKPELFASGQRTFSHGCMRIRNPQRMAEVLLEHQNVMTGERLQRILNGPKKLHRAEFPKHVPVHVTYFTMIVNEKGELVSRPDVYGHDARLAKVLGSGSYRSPAEAVAKIGPKTKKKKPKKTAQEGVWWEGVLFPN